MNNTGKDSFSSNQAYQHRWIASVSMIKILNLLLASVVASEDWFSQGKDYFEPLREKNRSSGFPTRSDTNRAVQSQKMARGLKFRI